MRSKKRATEKTTEEDANLRDTKPPALSEGEEAHEKQGVYKQVEMLIFQPLQNTQHRFIA
jgi:hypothetical protein